LAPKNLKLKKFRRVLLSLIISIFLSYFLHAAISTCILSFIKRSINQYKLSLKGRYRAKNIQTVGSQDPIGTIHQKTVEELGNKDSNEAFVCYRLIPASAKVMIRETKNF
jgi:hypothetical protein